jgi:competence protein ComFC
MDTKNILKLFSNTVLNTLFPSSCIVCKTKYTALCEKCIANLTFASSTHKATTYLFNYKNAIIKKALWSLKYKNNKEVGKIFARILYDKILEELSDEKLFSNFQNPLLIPIPLSKKRLKTRGFNQSEIIAQEMSVLDNSNSFTFTKDVLYKIKDTPSQVSIKDKEKRLRNLHGCFSVNSDKNIKDKNIILIDDITTTGATIAEAKKILLSAGAKKVIAFTIAH